MSESKESEPDTSLVEIKKIDLNNSVYNHVVTMVSKKTISEWLSEKLSIESKGLLLYKDSQTLDLIVHQKDKKQDFLFRGSILVDHCLKSKPSDTTHDKTEIDHIRTLKSEPSIESVDLDYTFSHKRTKVHIPITMKKFSGQKKDYLLFKNQIVDFLNLNEDVEASQQISALRNLLDKTSFALTKSVKTSQDILTIMDKIYKPESLPIKALLKLGKIDPHRASVKQTWDHFLSIWCELETNLDNFNPVEIFREILEDPAEVPWSEIKTDLQMTSWLIEHPGFKMKSQKKNQFETKPKKIHKFSSQHTTFPNHHKKDEKKDNKPDKTKSVNRIRHESINLNADRLGETSFQIELFGSRHESCKAEFDAGSDVNIISEELAKRLGTKFNKAQTIIKDYHHNKRREEFITDVELVIGGNKKTQTFVISDSKNQLILGKPTFDAFNLLQSADSIYLVHSSMEEIKKPIFIEGQRCNNLPIDLTFSVINETPALPTMPLYPPNLNPVMEALLAYLESQGFIEKDLDSSPHSLSAWPKKKPGKEQEAATWTPQSKTPVDRLFRLLLDASEMNTRIVPQEYGNSPPTLHQFKLLNGQYKYKSRVDLKNAFFGIKLPVHLRKYFAFKTHMGKFRMASMPQGAIFSPKYLQAVLELIMREFTINSELASINYADDLWLFSNQNKPEIISKLYTHLEGYGFQIAKEKTLAFVTEFDYGGFQFKGDQILPLKNHLEKIKNAKFPRTKNHGLDSSEL